MLYIKLYIRNLNCPYFFTQGFTSLFQIQKLWYHTSYLMYSLFYYADCPTAPVQSQENTCASAWVTVTWYVDPETLFYLQGSFPKFVQVTDFCLPCRWGNFETSSLASLLKSSLNDSHSPITCWYSWSCVKGYTASKISLTVLHLCHFMYSIECASHCVPVL